MIFLLAALLTMNAVTNGGFEDELAGWRVENESAIAVRTRSAYAGTLGIMISTREDMARLESAKFSFPGGTSGRVSFYSRLHRGKACRVSLQFYDRNDRSMSLPGGFRFSTGVDGPVREWKMHEFYATAPRGARSARIIIETSEPVKVEMDEFSFTPRPPLS